MLILGISKQIETQSAPKYLKTFYNNPVIFIACGSYHSLAITHDKKLYGWGEARLGQLGGVKKNKQEMPEEIQFPEFQVEDKKMFQINEDAYEYSQGYKPKVSQNIFSELNILKR